MEVVTLQAALTFLIMGNMVSGPLWQFRPTHAAPASSSFLLISSSGIPSLPLPVAVGHMVMTAGKPEEIKEISDPASMINTSKGVIIMI